MELRQLEHFVAVAEEQSFTRAARRLGYVQSALSVSVQAIERELGVQLFDRTTHSVQLTDAGRQLLGPARTTLAAAEEVRASAAAVNGVLSGTLRIGIMQAFTFLDVPALLGRFHREHPGVEIVMRPAPGGSAELSRAVADGTLDIAYVAASDVPPGVDVVPLGREELQLTAAPGLGPEGPGPVPLEELAGLSFIDFPSGWGVRSVVDRAFRELAVHRQVSIEVADVNALVGLVREGLGAAVLPGSLLPPGGAGFARVPLTPAIHWEVVQATPANRQLSAAARAFLAVVEAARPRT